MEIRSTSAEAVPRMCRSSTSKHSGRIGIICALLMLLGMPSSAMACPSIAAEKPLDAMKIALEYYAKLTASQMIEGADCAMTHFTVAKEQDATFRTEKRTTGYRYGRFLVEIADLQSRAAKRVLQTGGGTGIRYYERDIEVRTTLLDWCLGDSSACEVYKQLGALANAYEAANRGQDLHDWMLSKSPKSLVVADALKVWLRAVYSCPAWDFRPPLLGSLYTWRNPCTPGCITVAREAGKALKDHGPRISSLQDQISSLVNSVNVCDNNDEGTR
jgi:hypothetical protein